MKFYDEYIYYIVKDEHSKKLSLIQEPVILDHSPTVAELQKFYNYSAFLEAAYCNCLPMCPEKKERKDFDYIEIEFREKALAYEQTLSKIIKKDNVIAYSHRYGGFKGFSWKFNDEISFVINTNFGYGSVSYFFMSIYYNNLKLAPYSRLTLVYLNKV